MSKTVMLKVEGMTCNHCAQTVEQAVKKLRGVRRVAVSLERKEVSVDCDEEKGGGEDATIAEAIRKAGFEVVR